MAVVDTLITEYKMNSKDYTDGADKAIAKTDQFGGAVSMGIGIVTKFASAVAAVGAAYIGFGVYASGKAAEFDALVKALEAVVGGADKAKTALKELQEIAALPGLGLEEALKGYTSLRRADIGDEMSMRIIRGAGNANALASGGRAELNQILRAISQIAMKPNLSGEELMQLNEAGIGASKIIGDKFGTFDGGELKKLGVTSKEALVALVEGMEGLPEASGSAKNSIENLQMALEMAVIGIGTGINSGLLTNLDDLSTAIGKVTEGGLFESLGEKLADIVESAFSGLDLSAEGLEDQFVTLTGVAADVAQALVNLKLNIQDIVGFLDNAMPETSGIKMLKRLFDTVVKEGMGDVRSPSQQVRDEYEQKTFVPTANIPDHILQGRAEREANKEAEEIAEEVAGTAKEQTRIQMQIATNTKQMADIMLQTSTVGGSSYGDSALAPVNMSGSPIAAQKGSAGQLASIIQALVSREVSRAGRQR